MRRTLWMMIAAAMLAAGADVAVELESAIRRETVQGDLKGAAEAYRKIAAQAGSNREVAARALLRLGLVYRKQGDAQARQTLERLVRDYGDQKQVAAEARVELARMSNGRGKAAMAARQLWNSDQLRPESVSRDGRLVSFFTKTANMGVHDLHTGETRTLTQYGDWDLLRGSVGVTRMSPDGRSVAFSASTQRGTELRVIRSDGTNPAALFRSEERGWVTPHDWTPDSRQILCTVTAPVNEPGQPARSRVDLLLIAVPSGDVRKVKQDAGFQGGRLAMAISPDGRWIGYSTLSTPVRVMSIDGSVDTQITSGPGSDRTAGWSPDGKHLVFASDRSGSNGLYRIAMQGGKAAGAPELVRLITASNLLGLDSRGTLYYLDNPSSTDAYIAGLDAAGGRFTSEPARVTKRFEGRNAAPVWSPDGGKLAWFALRDQSISTVVIRDLASGQERELMTQIPAALRLSPSWLSGGNEILLATLDQKSTLYKMDTGTGAAVKLRGDLVGGGGVFKPSWSEDGSKIYRVDSASIHVWDAGSQEEKLLFKDPVASYVREITPSPDGSRIAYVAHQDSAKDSSDFYGSVHIKILDVASGQTRELVQVRPAWWGRMMTWTPDGKYLVYATEWYAGRSDEPTRLWVVPAAGGTPKQLGGEFKRRVFGLTVSPDGKQLGFDVTDFHNELWALENFLPQ